MWRNPQQTSYSYIEPHKKLMIFMHVISDRDTTYIYLCTIVGCISVAYIDSI